MKVECKSCPVIYDGYEGNFQKDNRIKSGYRGSCITCATLKRLEWRRNNIEIEKERSNKRSKWYYYRRKMLRNLYAYQQKVAWQEPQTNSYKDLLINNEND